MDRKVYPTWLWIHIYYTAKVYSIVRKIGSFFGGEVQFNTSSAQVIVHIQLLYLSCMEPLCAWMEIWHKMLADGILSGQPFQEWI